MGTVCLVVHRATYEEDEEGACLFHSSLRGDVLQNNSEFWEVLVDFLELGEEPLLGIQYANILLLLLVFTHCNRSVINELLLLLLLHDEHSACLVMVARDLSVEIQDHVLLLHNFENREIDLVVLNSTVAVRGHTLRIRLDTYEEERYS